MFISFHRPNTDEQPSSGSSFSTSVTNDSSSSCDSEPPLCIVNTGTPEFSSVSDVTSGTDQPSQVDDKFWITKDLFITKGSQKVDNRKSIRQENTSEVTFQKINYNCKTVQEHCSRCKCSTPRLHIYLLFGHRCNKSCSMSLNASAFSLSDCSQSVEEENVDDKVEDHSCEEDDQFLSDLSIDTEYVVVSDESFKFSSLLDNQPNVTKSTSIKKSVHISESSMKTNLTMTRSGRSRRYKRKRGTKWTRTKRKKTDEDTSLFNSETFTNICSTPTNLLQELKQEPASSKEDISGIPAEDFQKELLQISENCVKTDIISKSLPLSSDCWKDFQSLVKDEPVLEIDNEEHLKGNGNAMNVNNVSNVDDNSVKEIDKLDRGHGVANIISPMKMKISFNFAKKMIPVKLKDSNKMNPNINAEESQTNKVSIKSEFEEEENIPVAGQCFNEGSDENETINKDNLFRPIIKDIYSKGIASFSLIPEENLIKIEPEEQLDACESSKEKVPKMDLKNFECFTCDIIFDSNIKLTEHLEEHVSNGKLICTFCQKPFKDKTNMKRHMRIHTGEKPYKCKVCSKQFSLPGNFKKHRDIHSNIRTDPCKICGRTFKRREHLVKHQRIHTGEKPHLCTLCPSSFNARYSLHIHMNNHLGKKPYNCTFCSKKFSDRSTMRKHIRVHTGERPFKCSICNKTFAESGTRNGHMATHKEDRPFVCEECDMSFKTNSSLRQHYKIHVGVRPHCCKYCGNKFMQKYNLTTHERIHTGEKPFTCFHCDRCFRSKSCLQKHIVQIHSGEKQRRFPCTECNKRFYRSTHLKRHFDSHLGIKDYECKFCNKKFSSKASLRNHITNFHSIGARKFPCDKCGKVFKRQIYVTTHKCTKVRIKEPTEEAEHSSESPSSIIKEEESDEEYIE